MKTAPLPLKALPYVLVTNPNLLTVPPGREVFEIKPNAKVKCTACDFTTVHQVRFSV